MSADYSQYISYKCQLIIVSILAINAIFTIAIMTINYAMQVKPLFQICIWGLDNKLD